MKLSLPGNFLTILVFLSAKLFFINLLYAEQNDNLRILSLSAAATNILNQLEYPPVAIDQYGTITSQIPFPEVIGKGSAISLEKVKELQINCALIWYYQDDVERLLKKNKIRVIKIPPFNLSTYPELLEQLAKLSNREHKGMQLKKEFMATIDKLQDEINQKKKVKVYFELYSEWKAVGENSYLGEILQLAGASCPSEKSGIISPESIMEFSPDIIFFVEESGDKREISRRVALSSSAAVRNNRVYPVSRKFCTEGLALLESIDFFVNKIEEAR